MNRRTLLSRFAAIAAAVAVAPSRLAGIEPNEQLSLLQRLEQVNRVGDGRIEALKKQAYLDASRGIAEPLA